MQKFYQFIHVIKALISVQSNGRQSDEADTKEQRCSDLASLG